jgi:4-amino-4-deoxy-L-arabinose transferase-like glycosyltransferase
MAAFRIVGGPGAPFLVAPVLGCAAVALAAAIVRRRHDLPIAMLAAVLVATNPIFIYMSLQPMSDVPAAFWLLLAAFALWRPQPAAIAGGAAAGMALLTRPPLLPAIAAIGLVTRWRSRRDGTAFTASVGLFVILFALWLVRLYGSPFSSGYGTPAQLFTASTIRQNLANHLWWLVVANTPLVPIAFAAGWRRDRVLGLASALILAGVSAPYLVYASIFDDWEILRFLLPALVFVFAVCAIGVAAIARLAFSPGSARDALALTGVAIAVTIGTLMFLERRDAFDLWQIEMKYRMVGEWFAAKTPANAVAISSLHSGSLRYYSGRTTLLMDALPAGRLGEIVSTLRRNGYDPYVVLEQGDELSTYLGRFHPDGIPVLESDVLTRIRGVYVVHLSE